MSQLVRYHDGERWISALVTVGHKHLHAVYLDDCGVRVLTEPKEQLRHAEPLMRRGQPYPLERFLRHMRRFAKERGITVEARKLLEGAA